MYPKELTCTSDWKCLNPEHPRAGYEGQYCSLITDDGTMQANVDRLSENVVGRRIVSADRGEIPHPWRSGGTVIGLIITLDNGKRVLLRNTDDCCAYTELENFLLHPEKVDHIITGVGTTDGFTRWHIYADLGDVLELEVGWSEGNPFYYGYGFDIVVQEI